jgi:hypothetical protein
MGNDKKNVLSFEAILNRVKTILKTDSDKDVAAAINMKPNAFYNRKTSGSIPLTEFVCLANTKNVNIEWLVNGIGPIYKDSLGGANSSQGTEKAPGHKNNITQVIIEHQDMIRLFKDPERAKEINQNLLEIEEMSEDLMESIAQHIKSSLSAAKVLNKPSKKTQSDQDDIQNGKTA